MRRISLAISLCLNLSLAFNLSAQVTIGSDTSPLPGALLDLKERNADANNTNSEKGLVMPRVALTVPDDLTDVIGAPTTPALKLEHRGLWVYNVTENANFCAGLYVWDGSGWMPTSSVIIPKTVTSKDISTNTYIIKPGSILQFPVTKAYNVANDATWKTILNPADNIPVTPSAWDAQLVWQDRQGMVKSVSIIRDATLGQNSMIRVETAPLVCAEGNAVVSVTVNGVICWTWLLWITDYDPATNQKSYNNGTTTNIFMDRNIGALSNNGNSAKEAFRAMGLLYQWGRLAPIPGAGSTTEPNASYNSKSIYSINNVQLTDGTPTGGTGVNLLKVPVIPGGINLANSIQNPLTFYYGDDSFFPDWYNGAGSKTYNNNLWNTTTNTKSVFDPCPSGWRLPVFTPIPTTSPWYGIPITSYTQGTGILSSAVGYYPAAGYRNQANGTFSSVGDSGYYQSSNNNSNDTNVFMNFLVSSQSLYPAVISGRAGARSARCIKE